ncbi:MAG: hypothetical protein Q8R82_08660 [Hyphomonadaceae bacterium]|nr:hypothetical protein [Hyphomonadaceae bacterium]
MSRRILDRIAALEAALAPQPDRWAELRRTYFPVPMVMALFNDGVAFTARCRADWVAAGNILNDDARAELQWIDDGQSEAYVMAQQAKLIADGQDDIDRSIAREAERKAAAEREAKSAPKPQPKHKPTPTFVHHPNPFAHA